MFACHVEACSPRHNGGVGKRTAKKTKSAHKHVKVTVPQRIKTWVADASFLNNPAFKLTRNIGLGVLAVTFVVALFVFPIRDFFVQRSVLAAKNEEYETLADANERLITEINRLDTPEGIRAAARAQLGYVLPGEQRMSVTKMPPLPTQLPEVWPYTLVSDIVNIRTEQAQNSDTALSPLAP